MRKLLVLILSSLSIGTFLAQNSVASLPGNEREEKVATRAPASAVIRESMSTLTAAFSDMEAEMAHTREERDKATQQAQALQLRLTSREQEFQRFKADVATQEQTLQSQLAALQQEVERLRSFEEEAARLRGLAERFHAVQNLVMSFAPATDSRSASSSTASAVALPPQDSPFATSFSVSATVFSGTPLEDSAASAHSAPAKEALFSLTTSPLVPANMLPTQGDAAASFSATLDAMGSSDEDEDQDMLETQPESSSGKSERMPRIQRRGNFTETPTVTVKSTPLPSLAASAPSAAASATETSLDEGRTPIVWHGNFYKYADSFSELRSIVIFAAQTARGAGTWPIILMFDNAIDAGSFHNLEQIMYRQSTADANVCPLFLTMIYNNLNNLPKLKALTISMKSPMLTNTRNSPAMPALENKGVRVSFVDYPQEKAAPEGYKSCIGMMGEEISIGEFSTTREAMLRGSVSDLTFKYAELKQKQKELK